MSSIIIQITAMENKIKEQAITITDMKNKIKEKGDTVNESAGADDIDYKELIMKIKAILPSPMPEECISMDGPTAVKEILDIARQKGIRVQTRGGPQKKAANNNEHSYFQMGFLIVENENGRNKTKGLLTTSGKKEESEKINSLLNWTAPFGRKFRKKYDPKGKPVSEILQIMEYNKEVC